MGRKITEQKIKKIMARKKSHQKITVTFGIVRETKFPPNLRPPQKSEGMAKI